MGSFAFQLLLLVCVMGISATKSNHTMSRLLSYVGGSLKNKVNRKEFDAMTKKINRIENVVSNMLEQTKNESDTANTNSKLLLEAIKVEKNVSDEFRKEMIKQIKNINATLQDIALKQRQHKQNVCLGSCLDLYKYGFQTNGVFEIKQHQQNNNKTVISVYCDMTTDSGGWTVFQRRQNGSVDFNRDWNDYKFGFGELDGEFWLGNEYVNILTDDGETHELRIDLEDHDGNRAYAKYSKFKVGPESTNYTLEVSGYNGNAGDSLEKHSHRYWIHNGMPFSTKDRDNDNYDDGNCAIIDGGWWYNHCYASKLNAVYHANRTCESLRNCIVWSAWKGHHHNMKFTEMKLR
ncbi:microfibril-associated glycoprotein 4-like [Mercenaria mercenaria]|uniref:microfibril-associated glycoprotein 4-like n=1 Tax=Mercenaria mercenaria TaxID=6596 RepID=UPI00234F4097|nr:microfibril-associated glycoprotein 4-like [Mercenaria mercenaria]